MKSMCRFILNLLCFFFWAFVYVLAFMLEDNDGINWLCYIVGFIGFIYILIFLYKIFFSPIKRDLLLMSGRFLKSVVYFVLFVPFVISSFSLICDNFCGCVESSYDKTSSLLIGDEGKISETNGKSHVFWPIFYHFVDPGNQHMSVGKVGRGLAALIAILGIILLNGLLISTLINWFDNRKSLWVNGEIVYGGLAFAFCKKYAVVIGVDDNAPTIIRNLLDGKGECKNLDYVIVLTNLDVVSVRSQIYSYLPNYLQEKVIIYRGQLDALEQISKLRLKKAKEIYVLGEKQIEDEARSFHDIQNIKIVHNIASYLTDKCVERRVICRVLFEYQSTFSVFQFSDLPSKITDHLVFIPFNNYENWAQCVLVKGSYSENITKVLPMQRRLDFQNTRLNNILYSAVNSLSGLMKKNNIEPRTFNYIPLDGVNGISPESDRYVHFVVVGMSKMGIAMALQAAQIAHYPNFKPQNGLRTRITFIDSNADSEKDFFIGRFQNMFNLSRYRYLDLSNFSDLNIEWVDPVALSDSKYYDICEVKNRESGEIRHDNFIDIEWEFIKGNLEKESVKCYLRSIAKEAKENKKNLTIAICRPLAHEAIAAALYMPDEVYQSVQQIWVYQREASDMVANLIDKNNAIKYYNKIQPFGMSDADFTMDKENYYRAQLSNYVYCKISDDSLKNQRINVNIAEIGNASDKDAMEPVRNEWKKLNMAMRWSNKYLANSFETKLRCLGYSVVEMKDYYDAVCATIKKYEAVMAECEHNRWNLQQLLIGFRAYTNEELKSYISINGVDEVKRRDAFKKDKKNGVEKAHLNICSFEKLKEVDSGVMCYDKVFNATIPDILKLTEKARLEPILNKKSKK